MTSISEIVSLIQRGNDNSESISFDSLSVETNLQVEIIDYLSEHNCVKGHYDDVNVGDTINFMLDWNELLSLGIYRTKDEFIRLNQDGRRREFYIDEDNIYNSSQSSFLDLYRNVLKLRERLYLIAKYRFSEADIDYVILSSNQQSIVMNLSYSIVNFHESDLDVINHFADVLSQNNERRKLFIAELVDYFLPNTHCSFADLLDDFEQISERCNNSYEFYLSEFSVNKLKLEIDSKALEFTTKLQGVINESQTKLIAIPTAFVLAAASLNFDANNILRDSKNIAVICGMLMFAVYIQLFLSNQHSVLRFINESIIEYKHSFDAVKIAYLNDKFDKVDRVRKEQKARIIVANLLLWSAPAILIIWLIVKAFF